MLSLFFGLKRFCWKQKITCCIIQFRILDLYSTAILLNQTIATKQ
jgi:hypothetical protein